jgi:hypothetical protein
MNVDDGGASSDGPGFEVVDRRRLVLGGLAAATGAAVAASIIEPAAAANGSPVLLGTSNSASATTVISTTTSNGLQAQTSALSKIGVRGIDSSASGGGYGVWGQSSKGGGVKGSTTAAGYAGVVGLNTATAAGFGVRGITTKGSGVRGETSDVSGFGVHGINFSSTGMGVQGEAASGWGVRGIANGSGGYGVGASAYGTSGHGVDAYASGTSGVGVYAAAGAANGIGVSASAPLTSYAGYFAGNLHVTQTLSKGLGSFRIDHPVDPANKFLSHSFVESPDMMNIYNGVVVLDDDGEARVQMPDWFEALNRDFRYQLTAVGSSAPGLYVGSEMKDGSFTIAGGSKGQKVSWQVTGIRQDALANAHRIPVEEDKTEDERGKYLHPDVVKGGGEALHPLPKIQTRPKFTVPLDLPVP